MITTDIVSENVGPREGLLDFEASHDDTAFPLVPQADRP